MNGRCTIRRRQGRGAQPRIRDPEKVRELVNLWFAEAGCNQAFRRRPIGARDLPHPAPVALSAAKPVRLLPTWQRSPSRRRWNTRNRPSSLVPSSTCRPPAPRASLRRAPSSAATPVRQGRSTSLCEQLRRPGEQRVDASEDLPTGEKLISRGHLEKDGEEEITSRQARSRCSTGTGQSAAPASEPSQASSLSQAKVRPSAATAAPR